MRLLTELWEAVLISFDSLVANKLRSVLATLGIVIGVMTVTLMATAIEGIRAAFAENLKMLGTDVLYAQRQGWMNNNYEEWLKMNRRPPVTWQHFEAVQEKMTLAKAVAPVVGGRKSIRYNDKRSDGVNVIGSTDQFALTFGGTIKEGRFFAGPESDGGRPVCVLGFEVATNLFVGESPIGKRVKLDNYSMEVVGILEKQGNFMGEFSFDNQIIIPVRFFLTAFSFNPSYDLQVRVASMDQIDEAKEELRGILRNARKLRPGEEDDFAINQPQMILDMFNRLTATIASAGLFITGLSLFVGGIGIMNIMFVSVAERTREIGIRKAIGAKKRAILIQFLAEAAAICLVGGMIALAIAWPITLVVSKYIPAKLSLLTATLAVSVALATGLVSGFLPAWRAARMNPVDALRNE